MQNKAIWFILQWPFDIILHPDRLFSRKVFHRGLAIKLSNFSDFFHTFKCFIILSTYISIGFKSFFLAYSLFSKFILFWRFVEVVFVVLVGVVGDDVVSDYDFSGVSVALLCCCYFSLVSFVLVLIRVVGDDVVSDSEFNVVVVVLLCCYSFSFILSMVVYFSKFYLRYWKLLNPF